MGAFFYQDLVLGVHWPPCMGPEAGDWPQTSFQKVPRNVLFYVNK